MEVVSSLCFGQTTPPEPELIEKLLEIVFTEKDETKELSYSDKERTDKVPVIRSFLLQLLLEHKYTIILYLMIFCCIILIVLIYICMN